MRIPEKKDQGNSRLADSSDQNEGMEKADYSDTKFKVASSDASEIEMNEKEIPIVSTKSTVHKENRKSGKSMETLTTLAVAVEGTPPLTNSNVIESDSSEKKDNLRTSFFGKRKSESKEADYKQPTNSNGNRNDYTVHKDDHKNEKRIEPLATSTVVSECTSSLTNSNVTESDSSENKDNLKKTSL
jgi:hypothetical protein